MLSGWLAAFVQRVPTSAANFTDIPDTDPLPIETRSIVPSHPTYGIWVDCALQTCWSIVSVLYSTLALWSSIRILGISITSETILITSSHSANGAGVVLNAPLCY